MAQRILDDPKEISRTNCFPRDENKVKIQWSPIFPIQTCKRDDHLHHYILQSIRLYTTKHLNNNKNEYERVHRVHAQRVPIQSFRMSN